MKQKIKLIDPVDVDADGIAQAQSVASATTLTLNGALISGGTFTGDYARRIGIVSAGDDSGITFTVVGTDANTWPLTEVVTGGNATTVTSSEYFKTISSITTSGATAGNVTVGTVDEFVTNTIQLNHYNSEPATISLEDFSGTIDVSIDQTFSNVQDRDNDIQYITGYNSTAANWFDLMNHATGVRLVCNSYSSGAELKMVINQSRGG